MNYPELFDVIKATDEQIYGLIFRPTIRGHEGRENEDCFNEMLPEGHAGFEEYTKCNIRTLKTAFNLVVNDAKLIVEIGVDRSPDRYTFTKALMDEKKDDTIYLGIDVENRSYLDNPSKNVYTIQTNSANHDKVLARIDEFGLQEIDFLFIDGLHSINAVIADWKYVERLSNIGVVAMHDVRAHPGPYAVFEAIDEAMFVKDKFCCNNEGDHGMGVIRRREVRNV